MHDVTLYYMSCACFINFIYSSNISILHNVKCTYTDNMKNRNKRINYKNCNITYIMYLYCCTNAGT